MSGQPIIQIVSYEEKRVENYLVKLSEQLLRSKNILFWDINNGVRVNGQIIEGTKDPVMAIEYFLKDDTPGLIIFRDLNPLLKESTEIIRKLREAYKKLKNTKRIITLLSPDDFFPDALKKEIDVQQYFTNDYVPE